MSRRTYLDRQINAAKLGTAANQTILLLKGQMKNHYFTIGSTVVMAGFLLAEKYKPTQVFSVPTSLGDYLR